ncbi:Outer membrane receptor proteins, mostly Fe transport [Catalinimonas alkaloidigena]|uniref:Outer membrane receptor proteins, mostly Fe transport n=1 Tax=Catalinimonas alkaloidigena TaxID=1075417 RepID=A0A1G9JD46_9BACT|nr:TonB-dependent receptor [Catalinimonas alkaloidigena]SDL35499.1 Outer membrane receptor proteins, mostly Fe transport [Catalinimonas alkaloidigena]
MKPPTRYLLFCLFGLCAFFSLRAQQATVQVTDRFENKPVAQILADWQQRYAVRFFYQPPWLAGQTATATFQETPLAQALAQVLASSKLYALFYNERYVVLSPEPLGDETRQVTLIDTNQVQDAPFGPFPGGSDFALSGYVREAETGETVIGGAVYIEELERGTQTNAFGFYALKIPAGHYHVYFRSIGLEDQIVEVTLTADQTQNVELRDEAIQLREVTVMGEAEDANVRDVRMSASKMEISTMKHIPAAFGEVDVVRSLLLLPGVTSVGEGSAGFNVRGGSVDQNLVLLDDMPIFNASHLFGFFSGFNPDAVKDVTLYRGGVPASYGGRLSSVLDVKMKDGNTKEWTAQGGIGIVASRLTVEGPLVKDKSSLLLSGRGAYADLFLNMIPNDTVRSSRASFYDANLKWSYIFGERSRVYVSAYRSGDRFRLAGDTTFQWATTAGSVRWNYLLRKNLFANLSVAASQYQYDVSQMQDTAQAFRWLADVRYQSGKLDMSYYPGSKNQLTFGGSLTRYELEPGNFQPGVYNRTEAPQNLDNTYGLEAAFYASDEIKLGARVTMQLGLRYSLYQQRGAGKTYLFREGVPRLESALVDTLFYGTDALMQQYGGWEPRLAMRIGLSDQTSLKLSYQRMRQYIHLISNTTAVTPTDIWKLSDRYLPPQIADQYTVGLFRNFRSNAYETSLEAYYKPIQNLIDYREGATLLRNPLPETALLTGQGKAYGVEFLIQKKEGRLKGWMSYTYSRTLRQITGTFPEDQISLGEWYPANYDKPHLLNLNGTYQIRQRVQFTATFVYNTGRPVTYPVGRFQYQGIALPIYTYRNQGRIPDYHRLDVALTLEESLRKSKKWRGSWTFAVYNLYGRRNAYSVFFRSRGGLYPEIYKLSVIGAAIPSITYNFRF